MVADKSKDYLNQLSAYIQKNLAKGYSLDSLKFSLMRQGYSRVAVENAISIAKKNLSEKSTSNNENPEISYKEVNEAPLEKPKKSFFKRLFGLK
jgi:hypothetical protein